MYAQFAEMLRRLDEQQIHLASDLPKYSKYDWCHLANNVIGGIFDKPILNFEIVQVFPQ